MPSAPVLDRRESPAPYGAPPHPTAYVVECLSPRPDPAEELGDLIADVTALSQLGPDWDGDFAPPIDPSAIGRARQFLAGLRVPWLPLVGAVVTGGVRIEWDAGESYLIIDFEPDNELQVMYSSPGDDSKLWINDEIPEDLVPFYEKILRSRASFE